MSLLGKVKNTEVDVQERDTLGGFQLHETDVYHATVKMAFIEESKKGALGLNLTAQLADGSEYRETLWFTNQKKETFFTNTKGETQNLPGYSLANSITMLIAQTPILESETGVRVVKVYDGDAKGEVNKEVEALVDLLNQPILLAIEKQRQNKQAKTDSGYVATNEEVERNTIAKAFHHEKRVTLTEAVGKLPPEFIDKWLAKNQGKTIDKFKEVSGAPKAGSPTSGATTSAKKKTDLFDDE
ncbi:MAG: hypothetical protein CMC55_06615 [Flavobacteriaceae bacterium]|nr:hypothetical protein [Flavobacteriaceae bacterium]